jgi:diguanylate cyclase (GGDEF)-like protein
VLTAVQTDREGFVWAGSPQGLLRYDGHRWRPLEDRSLVGFVAEVTLDHEGTLWASFRDRGLAHNKDGRWILENRARGLPSDHIRRVVETLDAHGHYELWALSPDTGLLRHEGTRWVLVPGPEAAEGPRETVLSLARTKRLGGAERLWIGTGSHGVWYREGDSWHHFETPRFNPGQVEDLYATEDAGREELWISSFGHGLARLSDAGLKVWTLESGDLPTNELYHVAETRGGREGRILWIASRAGLIRMYGDRPQVFDRRYGLPADAIRDLSVWRAPNGTEVLWLATEGGMARTLAGADPWQTASLMGARATGVFGVLVEPDGRGGERLWVASTRDGIGLYDGGRWRSFNPKNSALPDGDTRFIKRVADSRGVGQMWAGLRYGHLLRVREGPVFEEVPTPWPKLPGQAVMDMLSRRGAEGDELWFATRLGLYRLKDGQWRAFEPRGATGDLDVQKLCEQVDHQGRSFLWATTNKGLARFDGNEWTLLGELGLPDTELKGVSLFPDDVLWVGSIHSGISRIDVGDPLQPRVLRGGLPPAPDPTAYSATRDSKGRIYICTNNGVQLLTWTGRAYDARVFTRRDGMIHDECNTNAQVVDSHDRFWTGTLGGVTVFDPDRDIPDTSPKPLKIVGVTVGGAEAGTDGVVLAPGTRDLRVEFSLLSWRREGESRFRTHLVGYEPPPGDRWTPENSRDFNGLPPGSYIFRLEGRDYAGNLSGPLELKVTVEPEWWQERWTQVGLGAVALLVAGLVFGRRTRYLESQRRDLEEQVKERTAALNDANARLLELSYRDALTGLSNRRRLLEALETEVRGSVALIFVDVDHFKDYNDAFGHPAGDEALRVVADAMRDCATPGALVARYGGEEFACILPGLDIEEARVLADHIRLTVAARPVPVPGTPRVNHVTISAGVARRIIVGPADTHALLRAADIALYQAKRDGRNCVRG